MAFKTWPLIFFLFLLNSCSFYQKVSLENHANTGISNSEHEGTHYVLKRHKLLYSAIEKRYIINNFDGESAWMDGQWKFYRDGDIIELYNLETDPGESNNLISEYPERAEHMAKELEDWKRSVELSLTGADYPVGEVESMNTE